jgi:hypothetical protein
VHVVGHIIKRNILFTGTDFSLVRNVQTGFWAYSISTDPISQGVETAGTWSWPFNVHIVSSVLVRGAVPPISPSCRAPLPSLVYLHGSCLPRKLAVAQRVKEDLFLRRSQHSSVSTRPPRVPGHTLLTHQYTVFSHARAHPVIPVSLFLSVIFLLKTKNW